MTAAAQSEQSGGITVETVVDAGNWPDVSAILDRAANATWSLAGDDASVEVAVCLTDDAGIRRLNADFRDKDKPTDVLSFPSGDPLPDQEQPMLGDVALALDFIAREAALENKSFEDHLLHLFVHGLLHLLGHDHEDPADAAEMEHLEQTILAGLGIADPYAGRELDCDGK